MRVMRAHAIPFLVVTICALAFHCGGQVDATCPSSTSDPCSHEGQFCDFPETLCGTKTAETCSCENGTWKCPLYQDCPAQVCPANLKDGAACEQDGQQCTSMSSPSPSCVDIVTSCTCDGTMFRCQTDSCSPIDAGAE